MAETDVGHAEAQSTATQSGRNEAYLAQHRAEIDAARSRIAPHISRTPTLSPAREPGLFLKCESLQLTGSFKVRGAFNSIVRLRETQPDAKGVIAVSSGNHAQAVALAARTMGFPAVIVIPQDANPQKVAATRALGAEVLTEGVTFENREERMREIRDQRGLVLVHPFDDWDVIHGQATAAVEILEDRPGTRLIVTPIGGGGLTCGSALAAKSRDSSIRVVAVEPAAADDAFRTWRTGTLQRLPQSPQTIADGVRSVSIGDRNFEVMVERGLIDGIVTVTEADLEEAVSRAWMELKLAIEPTAALPLAAWWNGHLDPFREERQPAALLVSGGNFDPSVVARLLSR